MADIVVRSLMKFWSRASIEAAWKLVLEAHTANIQDAVIVTGTSFKGSSSTFTLTLQPQERERFMTQCEAALAELDGGSLLPAAGTKLDFSTRITST